MTPYPERRKDFIRQQLGSLALFAAASALLRAEAGRETWDMAGFYTVEARKLEHGFRRISARILILYLKGMRMMMFQLSGYYYSRFRV